MLPRNARLRTERDHTRVRRFGRQIADPALALKGLRSNQPMTRIAVVVSKRVDKRAVVRNRIRRQVQALLEQYYPKLRPGIDLLILVRPAILTLSFSEIEQRLIHLFRRSALL